MKLYFYPNTCALAIHVLLEEIGKPYELARVDFTKREQHSPEYIAINPKSKVPMLERDDGSRLTELPAIAWYLARSNGQARLLPAEIEGEARALEIIDYLVATVHMRGFTRIFRPEVFSPRPEDKEAVQQAGREVVRQGFALIAPVLGDQDYLLGEFSIADAVLFFLEIWAVWRDGMGLPAGLNAHLQRMLARPAVQRALAAEGMAPG
jgi:glutathione S-transferase